MGTIGGKKLHPVEENAIGEIPWKGSEDMSLMVHMCIDDCSPKLQFMMLLAPPD